MEKNNITDDYTKIDDFCKKNKLTVAEALSGGITALLENDLVNEEEIKEKSKKEFIKFVINKKTYGYNKRNDKNIYEITIGEVGNFTSVLPYLFEYNSKETLTQKFLIKYIKENIFPKYYVDRAMVKHFISMYGEVIQGLKYLETKLNNFENGTNKELLIKSDDIHTLNLFFRFLNVKDKSKFLTSLKNEWKKESHTKECETLIYLYLLYFPYDVDIKKIKAEIEHIKNSSNNILSDISDCFEKYTNKNTYKRFTFSLDELYFAFHSIFDVEVSKSSIRTYCKNMNLKLKKVGQRNTQDYKNFTHPLLDNESKEKFLELVKDAFKTFRL